MTESSAGFWGWVERHKVISTVVGVTMAMVLIGSVSEDPVTPATDSASAQGPAKANAPAGDAAKRKRDRVKPAKQQARPVSAPARQEAPSYVVSAVIDGDTLELDNGERVRLVGIDTPEMGECGYEKAKARLAALVEGEQVALGTSDEDRDGYGRLLRYVDVGPVDAGLLLIEDGLAIARYDSRDGYGFHPREPGYVRADRGAPNLECDRPRTFVDAPTGCEPGYAPCVPVYPPDVDCADVDGPITVTRSDPHGLDGEGDGIACE